MNLTNGHNEILSTLQALGETNKFAVFEGNEPVGYKNAQQNGMPLPYVLVDFGGAGQQVFAKQGITGTRDNMRWTSTVFGIVAYAPDVARTIADIVRDTFDGFVADERWGEMQEVFNGQFVINGPDSTELWPAKYTRNIIYNCDVNA